MQLEDYFDFNTEPVEHIRIRGTRIGIDHVIELHKQHMTPEQIAVYFGCPISVEQAYATITYYLHNREAVDAYLARGEARYLAHRAAYDARPEPEVVKRLRAIKAARAVGGCVTAVAFLLDEDMPASVASALALAEPG